MFVGHYGPAGAADENRVKLWHAFLAVQFLDILWAPFILLGVEHARIVEGFTASNHFDLYHMPYTHSLVMAVVWSVAAGWLFQMWRRGGGVLIGGLVFSHWVFDLITHKPDLELWFGGPKAGLGLWDYPVASLSTEISLLAAGMLFYGLRTTAKSTMGHIAPLVLFAAMVLAQYYGKAGPVPPSANAAAISAMLAYVIFALLAAWVGSTRRAK